MIRTSPRRITVKVRGLPCDVVYRERGLWEVVWYLASIHWRLIENREVVGLTRGEILAIDAACLADLRERRADWCRRKREMRHAG